MKKSALVDWYLEQIETEIDSEATLNSKKRQVVTVIERLIKKDGVLIELGDAKSKENDLETVVIVHPNYVV